jgi:hypothetical protein
MVTSRRPLIPLFAVALGVLSAPDLEAQSANASELPPLTTGRTHEGTTMSTPGLTAATSQCAQAADPSYGTTPTSPIKIGGAPLYVADRSVKFMRTLRGPAGEPVHFKRLGSFDGPEDTILDVWLVERVGLSQHFYLDGYRTSEVRAPIGWLCAAETPLARSATSGSAARRQFVEVAAATFGLADAPISIDPDGSAAHGVIFDHARLIGRQAARERAGDQSIDAANVLSTMTAPRFVVVAYPLECPGREVIRAQTITVTDTHGQSPRSLREARGPEIGKLVAGLDAPGAALAVEYDANLAIPGQIVIAYDEPCGAAGATKAFPIRGQGGRITTRIAGQAPTGFAVPPGGMQVHVQVYFDAKGEPQSPVFAGGDGILADAAVAAVRQFRATPPTINGAPLLQLSTVAVAFPR